jgi:hypothetical protein
MFSQNLSYLTRVTQACGVLLIHANLAYACGIFPTPFSKVIMVLFFAFDVGLKLI